MSFGTEEIPIKETKLVAISGNPNGGAIYIIGTTFHNAKFTNTDYTTEAGRKSIISKSAHTLSRFIWRCNVANPTLNTYACIVSDIKIGIVIYYTMDPDGTATPVLNFANLPVESPSLVCQGDFCYVVKEAVTAGIHRFTSTPANNVTTKINSTGSQTSIF